MTENLQKRVALVTGAGKRLGRAVALRLAEDGCDVVVHYRSSEADARAVVGEIEKLGRRGVAIAADLNSLAEIKKLFQETSARFGRLDVLVNCAATFVESAFATTTEKEWHASLDSNLKAPFFVRKRQRPCCAKRMASS
jgi:NAD(P)-dependent dehydrogenase (short-subunit alcohol dehydrogenase family)